ncbi:hypothetical protein JCM10212_000461 [Sporobolomyces blumeae]
MNKWSLDYTDSTSSSLEDVRDPPGFVPALSAKGSTTAATAQIPAANLDSLRAQKAWEVALAPAKSVPMQAFMMYMSGGGIQVFSVMSVWFLLKQAVGGMLGVEKVFAPYTAASKSKTSPTSDAPRSFLEQKLVYLLCQVGLLLVGLWKLNSMGLLPTRESDWMAFRTYPDYTRVPIDLSRVEHLVGTVRYA